MGAAAARAASLLLNNLLTLVQGRWLLGLNPFSPSLLKPVLAGFLAFSVTWWGIENGWIHQSRTGALVGGITVFVVFLSILLLCGLNLEDKEVLAETRKAIHKRMGSTKR